MIYLDNAATAKPCEEAVKAAASCAFGNPSSLHGLGIEAEKVISEAKKTILKKLGKEGEIYFTSGATESNNQDSYHGDRTPQRCRADEKVRGTGV